jgi:glycosyltransferase involved in cell wall biosynthesis
MTEQISAYVPVYNNAATVETALVSIMRQTHAVDELLVIDDGSADASAEIAERLGARVVKHASNLGRGAVRATAMEQASHDLVLCCDATNILSSTFVAKCLHWFKDENVSAVFGRITQNHARSVADRWRGRHLFKINEQLNVTRKAKLVTFGTMVRKSAVMTVGNYNRAMRHSEDAELGDRLLNDGFDVILDPSLVLTSIARNTIGQVLERYSRWYGPSVRVRWYAYLRLLAYSIKCMAAQDVRERDILSVPISLLCPHVQFWRAYFSSGSSVPATHSNEK